MLNLEIYKLRELMAKQTFEAKPTLTKNLYIGAIEKSKTFYFLNPKWPTKQKFLLRGAPDSSAQT